MSSRRYRTKLEVLRDFLRAVRQDGKKSRIVALSNLNPTSFQRYLRLCLEWGLVQKTPHGFELSPRATVVLDRIDRLLDMRSEVDTAAQRLDRLLGTNAPEDERDLQRPRYISAVAWKEIVRREQELGMTPITPAIRSSPRVYFPSGSQYWWDREGQPSSPPLPEFPGDRGDGPEAASRNSPRTGGSAQRRR